LSIRIPVVLISGRNVTMDELEVPERNHAVAVLSKPFSIRSLQSALAAALAD
jgi:CheY-like chemotaxis protein